MRIDETTTAADVAELLGNLVEAARYSNQRHNDLLYAIRHKEIDDALDTWQVLDALERSQKTP